MSLGERIKEQRKKSGLSQEKVAEFVGVSRQAVTKWETGQSAPSTENLFKLAEIFGTTVDMLLASDEDEKSSPAGAAYGHSHYGWAIWGCIFGVFVIMGIILEKTTKGKLDLKSKKLWIWSAIFVVAIVATILFVRITMPT